MPSMAKVTLEKRSPLKDKPLRQAGQSLQQRVLDLQGDFMEEGTAILLMGVLMFFSFMMWLLRAPLHVPVIVTAIGFVGVTLYSLPRLQKIRREIKNVRLGRDGERIVSENLEPLQKEGAYVLHDLVGGNFNLDHVVISRHGVFVVETKTRSKRSGNPKVTFDGENLLIDGMKPLDDPLRQARANATWLKNLLKESTGKDYLIKPVVAFPGWWIESRANPKKSDVWVLEPKAIPKFISHEPVKLLESDVDLANFHLRRFIRSS